MKYLVACNYNERSCGNGYNDILLSPIFDSIDNAYDYLKKDFYKILDSVLESNINATKNNEISSISKEEFYDTSKQLITDEGYEDDYEIYYDENGIEKKYNKTYCLNSCSLDIEYHEAELLYTSFNDYVDYHWMIKEVKE